MDDGVARMAGYRWMLLTLAWTVAGVGGLRIALADWWLRQGTAASVSASVRWWPQRGEAHARLAVLEPERELEHLQTAVRREPRSSQLLIARALAEEFSGKSQEARDSLTKAMEIDRGFRPVWAWLVFLSRQGDQGPFWTAARRAFVMSHGDRQALFELCWSLKPDGAFLFRNVVSRQAPVLMEFVMFLMKQGELETAGVAYAALLEQPYGSASRANAGRVATREERSHVGMDLCDLLLDRGRAGPALGVWRVLQRWKLTDQGAAGRCFDFRMVPELEGVRVTEAGGGWIADFNGRQNDEVEVLWRPAVAGAPRVELDRRLRLETRFVNGRPREVVVYRRLPGDLPLRGIAEVVRSW